MATRIFAGDAEAVAQVGTGSIDIYDVASTYTVTINGKAVSTIGTGGTVDTTAVALVALLTASDVAEFVEVNWTNPSGSTILATAATEGVPFTAVLSVSGGTGTVTAFAATTANDGPNVWSANNFKAAGVRGTIPASSDTVIIRNSSVDILYNLDQTAVAILDLQIAASYTGIIGLPKTSTGGYDEYRTRSLTYTPDTVGTVLIGDGDGNGSTKLRLTLLGADLASLIVRNTDISNDEFPAAVVELGSAVTDVIATGGTLAIASSVSCTIGTLAIDNEATVTADDTIDTLTAVDVIGGTLTAGVATVCTTLTLRDSATVTWTGGNITTANVLGGTLNYTNTAAMTVTTTTIGTGGRTDSTNATAAITNTNSSWNQPGSPVDPSALQVFTNPVDTNNGLISEFTALNLGRGRTWLPGS